MSTLIYYFLFLQSSIITSNARRCEDIMPFTLAQIKGNLIMYTDNFT